MRSTVSLAAVLAFALCSSTAVGATRLERAAALFDLGQRHVSDGRIDMRRQGLEELDRATRLAPERPEYELELARAYYASGYLKESRLRFERVRSLVPENAEAAFGLGQVWRRDWLKYLDTLSLVRAAEHYSLAARLEPARCDAWLSLVPLLVSQGDDRAAWAASVRAREADPQRLEPRLADAWTSFRLGRLARADSLFAGTIPKLRRNVRARFDDIAPLATERDTMTLHRLAPSEQAEFVAAFWKEHDPDLASPENEARLEYWARVTNAYFLFYDARRREWDERGEIFVRYGPPANMTYNPIGASLSFHFSVGPEYPANVLAWEYPELGMHVLLQDRTLNEIYRLPVSLSEDTEPLPDPDSLAKRSDAFATRGGRAVFHVLPPNVEPRPVAATIARFRSSAGTRLLAQLGTPGAPDEGLVADWVVLDTTRREVARARRALDPSGCDPTGEQIAEFATDLPPGPYVVGLTVRDAAGRRGVKRSRLVVEEAREGLALSDVVVSCGLPPAGLPNVQILANPGSRVAGNDPLTAYFEVYGLASGGDGRSRFEYEYTVKSADRDPRVWLQRLFSPRKEPAPLSASRSDEQVGAMRRQFVSVPVQSLPPGRYQLSIRVRDRVSDDEAVGVVRFERLVAPAASRP